MAQGAECVIQMTEVQGTVLTVGNILLQFFFCFHIVKPLMPILPLLPILCVCEKLVLFGLTVQSLLHFSNYIETCHSISRSC